METEHYTYRPFGLAVLVSIKKLVWQNSAYNVRKNSNYGPIVTQKNMKHVPTNYVRLFTWFLFQVLELSIE